MKKYNFLFILAFTLTILIGIWIRFSGIFSNSFAFTYDVGRDLIEVHKFVVGHKPFLIGQTTGLPGLFYGPWWYYFLSVPFILFSGNPQFIAGFMAFVGVICIFLISVIGYKMRDKYLGLTFAVLFSFSPYFVGLSAQIWNPNISQFYLLIIMFLLVKLFLNDIKTNKYILVLLGLFLGLLMDSEIVFGLLFSVGVLLSFLLLLKNKNKSKEIFLIFIGFLVTQVPRVLFEIRHDFIQIKTIFSGTQTSGNSSFSIPTLEILFERIWVFNSMFADTFTGGNNIYSIVLIVSILVSVIFTYKSLNFAEKIVLKLSAFLLFVLFFGILFLARPAWGHYLIGLPVVYIIISGICISSIRFIKYGKYMAIIILLLIAFLSLDPIKLLTEIRKPLWEGNAAVYRNQVAVIDYIYSQTNGKPFNLVAYTPAVHAYSYNYLFLWYGQKKFGYQPIETKTKLFMLIIEPDYDNDWRVKDWLEIRKNDGVIVKEAVVKGGIKVQTREH